MLAVGLMSGTSLDGVDAVLCEVTGVDDETKIRQLAFQTYPIPKAIKGKIRQCCSRENIPVDLICSLNFELGELFAKSVLKLCQTYGVSSQDLAFVASHGQTIFHIPKAYQNYVPSTLQIGEAAIIAERCQCTVISNFRTMDLAVGGEGAPLVPFSERILYRQKEGAIALQNIGGIGNVTVIPDGHSLQKIIAFDTGPGNMMIDEAVLTFFGKSFDADGAYARQGEIVETLADELKEHPYFRMAPPKSTGREMFGAHYTQDLLRRYKAYEPVDIIHTLTWFAAYAIGYHYRQFVMNVYPLTTCVVAGGGAYNSCLMDMIQKELPEIEVLRQEDLGFSSEAKEAIAFVVLGNQTYHRRPSNVPSATGAKKAVILGQVTYPTLN